MTERRERLKEKMTSVACKARDNALADVTLADGNLRIAPLRKNTPESAEAFAEESYALMPHVKIQAPPNNRQALLTAVLADGINLGLTRMSAHQQLRCWWALLHRFKGRGGNQVRLEIPVLATARHPYIASAQAIAQLRESAQFVEMPIHPVCPKHVGPPARFYETRWHMFGQRALAASIEVAEQIESLQQFSCGRCRMELEMRK